MADSDLKAATEKASQDGLNALGGKISEAMIAVSLAVRCRRADIELLRSKRNDPAYQGRLAQTEGELALMTRAGDALQEAISTVNQLKVDAQD